ncbi:ferredoxin family protein [Chloroflexota bacterium]
MGIKEINLEECTGCGLCYEACPMDVIRMNDEGKSYVSYPSDCIVCYSCERDCPFTAVIITPERPRTMPTPW